MRALLIAILITISTQAWSNTQYNGYWLGNLTPCSNSYVCAWAYKNSGMSNIAKIEAQNLGIEAQCKSKYQPKIVSTPLRIAFILLPIAQSISVQTRLARFGYYNATEKKLIVDYKMTKGDARGKSLKLLGF